MYALRQISLFIALSHNLVSCFADEQADFSWNSIGEVTNAKGQMIRLDTHFVASAKRYNNALFLIGTQVDKSGNEHSKLSKVSSYLQPPKYWSFEEILKELFIYKENLYLSDYAGSVFKLVNERWLPAMFSFPANSEVVYASKEDLIACYPHSLRKADPTNGACCSIEQEWCTPLNWRERKPSVCKDHLYVFENNKKGKEMVIKKIDLKNGKILDSVPMERIPEAIECEVTF